MKKEVLMDKFESDKKYLLDWFGKYCNGVRNARTRENILPYVKMEDRYFRTVASALIHDGHIASSSKFGYWSVPLVSNDTIEIEALKQSILERKSKALAMIEDCHRQLEKIKDIELKRTQGQKELEFVDKE